MTAKKYLRQLRTLKYKINWARNQYEQLMETGGAIRYDKLHVKSSPEPDQMAERVIKAQTFAEIFKECQDKYEKLSKIIIWQIENLGNDKYTVILLKYYVGGESLAKIAEDMHYSHDWVRHMHMKAVELFAKKYGF